MSATDVANITAPPVPWTARAIVSINGVDDRPQTRDETVKIASPMANTPRRPRMSPITPAVSKNTASVSE